MCLFSTKGAGNRGHAQGRDYAFLGAFYLIAAAMKFFGRVRYGAKRILQVTETHYETQPVRVKKLQALCLKIG